MRRGSRRLLAVLAVAALVGAACGSDDDPASGARSEGPSTAAGDGLTGSLVVFAAASLTEAFTQLGAGFEADHPDLEVTFNFAASSALAQQIGEGAPADVVASADEATMAKVTAAGDASDPATFARNRLALLVERGNPKGIRTLADLGRSGVVFVVCAPEVPCGRFAAAALSRAKVTANPASLEENVKAVVSRVTLGEADAGIVYATDVRAAGDQAEGVAIDIATDPALEAVYPIAVTTASANEDAARAWTDHVLSDAGQATLARFGFLPP